MSKELIRPDQFAHADSVLLEDTTPALSDQQKEELSSLYEGVLKGLCPGKLIKGTIVQADGDGFTVDIGYKSYGLIPRYEFSEHEFKTFKVGDSIEVNAR